MVDKMMLDVAAALYDDDDDNDDDVDDKLTFSNKLNSCRSRFQHNSCNTFLFRC